MCPCHAQDITVHVIDSRTQKPLKGLSILLHKDCENPKRPKALERKTDSTGTVVFRSQILTPEPICINPFSIEYAYAPRTIDYIFTTPEQAKKKSKSLNPIVTALPAEIEFPMQKRSLGEQFQFLFQGP